MWRPGWMYAAAAMGRDIRIALRSLGRAKGLSVMVILTLALGIGANAAIFSVVRGVLLRPLVNRDEDRLIYIRQTAPGIGGDNVWFSMPEIRDLESQVKDHRRVRRLFDRRPLTDWLWRSTAHGEGRRRQRIVLRGHGAAAGARPAAEHARRRPESRTGRGAHLQILDRGALGRSERGRPDHPPRSRQRHRRRGARAVGAVPGRHGDHRERRDESAPHERDDGHETQPSHDGAVRPSRPRRFTGDRAG